MDQDGGLGGENGTVKRIEITSAGCPATYIRPTDGVVAPCEYGTMSIIQMPTEDDVTAEVDKAVKVYEAALGAPATPEDRARFRVDALRAMGYPTLWTPAIEQQTIKDVQAAQAKVMAAHAKATAEQHPHADPRSKEHRRAVRPARKPSVVVTDVPLGTDVRPRDVKAARRRS